MKILVVDDEPVILSNLKQMLENYYGNIHTIYALSDSREAMQIIIREQPEILLTDIRMPGISGITLAQFIREHNLRTKVLFITGYSDFEYAKAGIEYKIFDYLLKPIDSQKAINSIKRAIESYEEEESLDTYSRLFQSCLYEDSSSVQKKFLNELLFYPIVKSKDQIINEEKALSLSIESYRIYAIGIAEISEVENDNYNNILIIEQYLNSQWKHCYLFPFGNILYVVDSLLPEEQFHDTRNWINSFRRYREDIQSLYSIDLYVGISCIANDLSKIQKYRKQAGQCLQNILFPKLSNKKIDYYKIAEKASNEPELDSVTIAQELIEAMQHDAPNTIDPIVDQISKYLSNTNQNIKMYVRSVVFNILYYVNTLSVPAEELNEIYNTIRKQINVQTREDLIIQYFRYWLHYLCDCIKNSNKNDRDYLTKSIFNFVDKNYSKPIGLTDVAEYIHRNPSYVSRLIKKETGENFSEILSEKRINNAKKQLKETNLKIAEIAESNGYPNVRYFTKVFHSKTDMSPLEYRRISQTLL